jgi:hypothetical protein
MCLQSRLEHQNQRAGETAAENLLSSSLLSEIIIVVAMMWQREWMSHQKERHFISS